MIFSLSGASLLIIRKIIVKRGHEKYNTKVRWCPVYKQLVSVKNHEKLKCTFLLFLLL